ncbi:VOC family protein [Chondromyces crocatus]|uniref:Glyoxalase n=1 Tax=Chondromyces crocatus TaxID=52 RepID=A0A0K1EC52_CHOCO|nr:VOC family protein [Chondromyces crocatus]AKT38450.1 glyoxalase [Chondromyces crocatus]
MAATIDHITINVRDRAASTKFYEKVLAVLGIKLHLVHGAFAGFGRGKPEFWIAEGPGAFQTAEHLATITPVHVCFSAETCEEVDAFYRAALEAGGKDNGAPGIRAQYHPGYYGAFILDPDGHNIEAVCHFG